MHANHLTQALAAEHRANILADAETRRLLRSLKPRREPRPASRRFAQVLLLLAHRIDPSVATTREDPAPITS